MRPQKYINVNGVPRLNPEWQSWQSQQSDVQKSTVANPAFALPIVTTIEDISSAGLRVPKPLQQVFDTVQSSEYVSTFKVPKNPEGEDTLGGTDILDGLSKAFDRNEIPIGLMGHLTELRWFAKEFLCDDSGSMADPSNLLRTSASVYMKKVGDYQQYSMTRWEEIEDRIHIMIDLLAFVPGKPITIRFFNHEDTLVLDHYGKTPQQFATDAHQKIRTLFSKLSPTNGTPIFRAMKKSIDQAVESQIPTMHYVLTDGSPSGGKREIAQIEGLLVNGRGNRPDCHPVTFCSCSNNRRDIEWMHESEECADFVAALHDFIDEQQDVTRDQGRAFPYSRGLWLLANLAAARDPNGLDAMDQHAPLTKCVLDSLLGRVHTEGEYIQYFTSHPTYIGGVITATNDLKHLRRIFEPDYQLFLNAQVEGEIPSVIFFKYNLAQNLRADIANDDDNSEAPEIVRVERLLLNAREQNQFAKDNAQLQYTIEMRKVAAQQPVQPPMQPIQQQAFSQRLNACAMPQAVGTYLPQQSQVIFNTPQAYASSDGYSYPAKPGTALLSTNNWRNTFVGGGNRRQQQYVPAQKQSNNDGDCCSVM